MPEQPPPFTPMRKYLLSFDDAVISFLISSTAEWVRRTGDNFVSIIILQNGRLKKCFHRILLTSQKYNLKSGMFIFVFNLSICQHLKR